MAKIWRNRIVAGTRTFGECPERYQTEVIALLKADVEDNTITAEEFESITGLPYSE